ncbi:MAG TPA: hypothetical protein VGU69_00315 [Rhizomicrobium sp.]|nr:hypothetical protein [Rhizomicrobium sp.]
MTTADFSAHAVNPFAAGAAPAAASAVAAKGNSGFTFDDLLDIVNPLQHLPVVSTLYRAISDDTIKPGAQLAGDTLYGGMMGFASSMGDLIFTKITGKSVGDTVLGWAEDITGIGGKQATGLASNADPTKVAGKDFGHRVIAWLEDVTGIGGGAEPTALASNVPSTTPVSVTAASLDDVKIPDIQSLLPSVSDLPDVTALMASLTAKGTDPDLARRATAAYRSSLDVAGSALATIH